MFRNTLLFTFLNLALTLSVKAQLNLVFNGDFEIFDTCPEHISFPWDPELQHCTGWDFANWGTADYYNACAPVSIVGVSVPYNFFGYQPAYSGQAYTGIYSYTQYDTYREYIQSELTEPLTAGVEYYVEFYVSLADHSAVGTNRIGALFTHYRPYHDGWDYIPSQPQVENPLNRLISDTLNWTKISGSFVAQGGERYITIGNFFDWTETDTTEPNLIYIESTYYYVDGVSVQEGSNNLFIPNIFSPNQDGNNDLFYVRAFNAISLRFTIFNRWGETVFRSEDLSYGWDGTFKGQKCEAGVYFYAAEIVFRNGEALSKKGSITLLR